MSISLRFHGFLARARVVASIASSWACHPSDSRVFRCDAAPLAIPCWAELITRALVFLVLCLVPCCVCLPFFCRLCRCRCPPFRCRSRLPCGSHGLAPRLWFCYFSPVPRRPISSRCILGEVVRCSLLAAESIGSCRYPLATRLAISQFALALPRRDELCSQHSDVKC